MLKARRLALAVVGSFVLVACGSDPAAPATANQDEEIATTLDGIAQEQAQRGDHAGGREIAWAAAALRAGIEPSQLAVTNDGAAEMYQAFVQSLVLNTPAGVPPWGPRLLVAWRRVADAAQVIAVSSMLPAAPVLHPWSLGPSRTSPLAGAQVSYFSGPGRRSLWVGVSGDVHITPSSIGADCPVPTPDHGNSRFDVTCKKAQFLVAFDAVLQRVRESPRSLDPESPTRRLTADEQTVNGLQLVFECARSTRDAVCP